MPLAHLSGKLTVICPHTLLRPLEGKIFSRPTALTTGLGGTERDAAYLAQSWVYDLIKIKTAWQQGYSGKGVHIRINDDGIFAIREFEVRYGAHTHWRVRTCFKLLTKA